MNRHIKGCFGGWYGNWFTLVVLALGALLSTSTAVQAQECVPDCRKGYVCAQGKCVSICNPPCPEGQRCTSDAKCVSETVRSSKPAAAVAVTPSIGGTYVAPPDKALVLFVRPAKAGKAVNFYVFDGNKRLVTLFKGNEHVAVTAGPGKHTFYVVSENAELVRAEVGAGRTYVIYTEPRMGLGKARVMVEAVVRTSQNFAESAEWLRKTKAGVPDFAKGNKWASKRQDVLNTRIADAEANWSGGDAAYRAARTMRVEDGRNAAEAGGL